MICCPGLDFCSLANARSIPIAAQINERFDDLDYLYDLGEIQLKMSGCMNGCGHHSVGHIGILGVDKSGEEWYQITLGGSTGGQDASLGEVIGPSVAYDEVVDTIERIIDVYVAERQRGRALPRHLPPHRRGTFQGSCICANSSGGVKSSTTTGAMRTRIRMGAIAR